MPARTASRDPRLDMTDLFRDRAAAGRQLAPLLAPEVRRPAVVVGLARGGVVVAAEVARALGLPLEALAVRKVRDPVQPELAAGAVAPEGVQVLFQPAWLTEEELSVAIARARAEQVALEERLARGRTPAAVEGADCVLVDDGLATGATMLAAIQWARARRAGRVIVGVPVAASGTATGLRRAADVVVCVHELVELWSVGTWYEDFGQVDEEQVLGLLEGPPAEAPGPEGETDDGRHGRR
jgi:putative phosphoribosyl transferase